MNTQIVHASILLLCSSLSAQYVTSPPGFINKEGNNNATFSLGTYADGHFQYIDGTHRGTAMSLKGTAYRLGNYAYTSTTGTGRSWTNVQLRVSHGDLSNFSSTYSKNSTSTPTLVFSSSMSWPTATGKPATLPAAWSIQFPFSSPWSYSGAEDLILDYEFTGGTLANSGNWAGSASSRYYKDSQSYPTSVYADSRELGESGANVGCNDRGTTHVNGADVYTRVTVYSGDYSNASLRNTLVFTQNGRYYSSSHQALTVLGLRSLPQGFDFAGIGCNKVYIDFSLPTFTIPSFTNSSGNLVTTNLSAPNPGLKGIEFVTQVIWNDTKNGRPLLSSAAAVPVPELPPSQPQSLVYQYNTASTTGNVSSSRSYQPVVRLTR